MLGNNKHHAHHTMSVHKRPGSPYWYIQFQLNGRTYLKSSKSTDKRIALKLEIQWRSQLIEEQQLGVKPTQSLNDAFQAYSSAKQGLTSHPTIEMWCRRATSFWSTTRSIHDITSAEIEKYKAHLASASYAAQSIKHALNHVAGTIKYAKRLGFKTADVQMPTIRLPKGRLQYLSIDEEQRLLKSLDPQRSVKGLAPYEQRTDELRQEMQDIQDLVIVLLDTGARHTEITTLKWDAVNLQDRTIRLWRPKVQNQSILFMSHRVHDLLTRRYQNASSAYIFTNSQGDARQYRANTFRRAFDRVGLRGYSIHTLRHTHATRLIQNGLNLYEVKEILGHADIKTTMRYAHLEQAKVSQKAIDVINNLQSQRQQ